MSTTFFQQQDQARRNTGRLVFLFILAVLALIALTYLVCYGLFVYVDQKQSKTHTVPSVFQPTLLLAVALGVIALIGCGSAYKIAQLSSGGQSVALLLGGQEIPTNTRDFRQKRVLNVVEEMAIASGVPVPPVFLLPDEKGINAFAAGYAPGDAVVAVSQGCLDYLTRDELQGVIAHEFSHVLNGDMRLNIRLMGMIHGIVIVSLVGLYLMHVMSRSGGSSSNKKGGLMQLFLLGLALYILGSVGAFFGMLIQAAVSRQREFLADASAVQFTRNPDGIGGALKKIGGLSEGATIDNAHKTEMSHMFFADAVANRLSAMLATHPPLDMRIRAVDPRWDGAYPDVEPLYVEQEEKQREKKGAKPPLSIPGMPQLPLPIPGAVLGFAADRAEQRIGTPTAEGLAAAAAFTEGITDEIREIIGEPFSARAAIYAMLFDANEVVRKHQIDQLRGEADPRDVEETLRLVKRAKALPPGTRLTVVHLAIPALRSMSPRQYETFRAQVAHLIEADEQVDLFEFCLQRVLLHHLDLAFELKKPPRVRYRTEERLIGAAAAILSTVAREGHDTEDAASAAYKAGYREWLITPAKMPAAEQHTMERFAEALDQFAEAAPFLKKKLIRACVTCIVADEQVTPTEYELLRAICSSLDCPLPPLTA
jgi:Zn-dependent protease with chaperone function